MAWGFGGTRVIRGQFYVVRHVRLYLFGGFDYLFLRGLMQDVVEDGTVMQTYTEGQRILRMDSYAVPAFKVMFMIKPVKDYSPIEKLTKDAALPGVN